MDVKAFFHNWIVKNILGAILALLGLVLVFSLLLNLITNHNKVIEVPDFSDMKLSEAKYTASTSGVKIDVADSVYVKRMAKGAVFSQNPKAGSKVKKGRHIHLTINSIIPRKIKMPNLIGYSMRQADAELTARGLNLGKLIYVGDIATNNVLRQIYHNREISPGSQIESGSDVDLVVGLSGDDSQTHIPNVKGLKYLRAVESLHASSLNVGRLSFDKSVKDYSDSLNAVVYQQTPGSSQGSTTMGSEVSLYLTVDESRMPK